MLVSFAPIMLSLALARGILSTLMAVPQPTCHRHPQLQLNFLDDYKADQNRPPGMEANAVATFMSEVNSGRMEELRQVAHVRGTEDGVDWRSEELAEVHVTAVDDRGMLLNELICSAVDQRCIAVTVE